MVFTKSKQRLHILWIHDFLPWVCFNIKKKMLTLLLRRMKKVNFMYLIRSEPFNANYLPFLKPFSFKEDFLAWYHIVY